MKKLFCLAGGVLVLLFILALPSYAQSPEQRIVSVESKQKAPKKKATKKATQGKKKIVAPIERTRPATAASAKVKSAKPTAKAVPLYYNPVIWLVFGLAFLFGGILGGATVYQKKSLRRKWRWRKKKSPGPQGKKAAPKAEQA